MLCYKDMTFCSYWEECGEKPCPAGRELTDEVKEKAGDFAIARFMNKPECFREPDDE